MCQSSYFQNECCSINHQEGSDVWAEFGESTVCYSKVINNFFIIKIIKNVPKQLLSKWVL